MKSKTQAKTETKIRGYFDGFNAGMKRAFSTGNYRIPGFHNIFVDKSAQIGYTEGFNTCTGLMSNMFINSNISDYCLPEIMKSSDGIFPIRGFEDVQRYYNIYKKIDILKSSDKRLGYKIQKRDHLEKVSAYKKERIINYENFSEETNSIRHIKYNKTYENFEITPTISNKDIFKSSLIYFISNPSDVNLDIKQDLIYISYSDFNLDLKNILPSSIELNRHNDICFKYDKEPKEFYRFLVEFNRFFKEIYMKEKLNDFIIVTSDNHSFWISIIIPFCLLFNELILEGNSIIFPRGSMHTNGRLIYNGDILEYLNENKVYDTWKDPIIDENTSEIRAILSFKTGYLRSNHQLIVDTNTQILNFIETINPIYSSQIKFIRGDSNYETDTHKKLFIDYHRITLQHNNINYDYLFKHGIRGTTLDEKKITYDLFCINFDTIEREIIKKIIYNDILYMYRKTNIDINLPMPEFIDKCKDQMGNLLKNKRVVIYGHSLDYLLVNIVLRDGDYLRYIKKVKYPDDLKHIKQTPWFLTQTTIFYPKYFLRDSEPGTIQYLNPIGPVLDAQNEMIEKIDNDPLNIINAICLDNIRAQSYSLTDMADKKFYGSKLNLNFSMTLIKLIIIMVIILIIIIVIILICNKTFKKNSSEPN